MSSAKNTQQNEDDLLVVAIDCNGDYNEIFEMYESFSGWYWFTLIKHPYPDDPKIRSGYVVGFEPEFGTFDLRVY